MKEIWTTSKAECHGELVNFDPMMTWSKPAQKPHPPIIVGGAFRFAHGPPCATATLDAPPHAQPVCGHAEPAAEIPRNGDRGGTRSRVGTDYNPGRQGESQPCSSATATMASQA